MCYIENDVLKIFAKVFFFEFCKNFKNTFYKEHFQATVFAIRELECPRMVLMALI